MKRIVAILIVCFLCAMCRAERIKVKDKHGHERNVDVQDNQAVVRFKNPPSAQVLKRLEKSHALDAHSTVFGDRVFVVHSKSKKTLKLLEDLKVEGEIETVEPDQTYMITTATYQSRQWALANTGQTPPQTCMSGCDYPLSGADAKFQQAHDAGYSGSQSVVVLEIDTGVDYNHPDLAGNIWTAPSSYSLTNIFGTTLNCAVGTHGMTAYVDHGTNVYNCDPMDVIGHGTHVAGIVGAKGVGVVGASPNVTILPIKNTAPDGMGSVAGALAALNAGLQFKQNGVNIRVSTNSWMIPSNSQLLHDAFDALRAANILVVSAASNDGPGGLANNDIYSVYPAGWSDLSVAALDQEGLLADFSNFGPSTVHLGAPGVNIFSTVAYAHPLGSECVTSGGGKYCYLDGTSMATPEVSGAVALIAAAYPTLTAAQIRSAILSSVTPSQHWRDFVASGGYLNAYAALQAAATINSNPGAWTPWTPPSNTILPAIRPTIETRDTQVTGCEAPYTNTYGQSTAAYSLRSNPDPSPNFYDGAGYLTYSSLDAANGTYENTYFGSTFTGFLNLAHGDANLVTVVKCDYLVYGGYDPAPCAIEYTINGGSSWTTLRQAYHGLGFFKSITPLPTTQDLSLVGVRACAAAAGSEHSLPVMNMREMDIRIEGDITIPPPGVQFNGSYRINGRVAVQ